jgi:hypothetical protein
VHRVVGGLLYARNFYIALLSEEQDHLMFPYSVDERDQKRQPRKLGHGLTEYVLRTGSALLADRRPRAPVGRRRGASDRQRARAAGSACR